MRFLILCLCLMLLRSTGFAQNAVAIARQYSDAVVMIVVQDAQHQNLALGSGLVVELGKVLTNKHVIEGAKFGYALTAAGKKFPVAGIHALDGKNDLALLSIPGLQASAVRISRDSVEIGQRIYAIGNPEGLSNSISEGIVSGYRRMQDCSLYQITAPISPGSSGGPIVDNMGNVVGIAVGAMTSGQNLNFAIPISLLFPLLDASTVLPLNIGLRKPTSTTRGEPQFNAPTVKVNQVKYSLNDPGPPVVDQLEWISILNNSDYTISRVRVVLILYSASGMPLDYVDLVLCKISSQDYGQDDCVSIAPGLARSFDLSYLRPFPRLARKERGEKIVSRVLDYEIIRD